MNNKFQNVFLKLECKIYLYTSFLNLTIYYKLLNLIHNNQIYQIYLKTAQKKITDSLLLKFPSKQSILTGKLLFFKKLIASGLLFEINPLLISY